MEQGLGLEGNDGSTSSATVATPSKPTKAKYIIDAPAHHNTLMCPDLRAQQPDGKDEERRCPQAAHACKDAARAVWRKGAEVGDVAKRGARGQDVDDRNQVHARHHCMQAHPICKLTATSCRPRKAKNPSCKSRKEALHAGLQRDPALKSAQSPCRRNSLAPVAG